MNNEKCSRYYPKKFQQQTIIEQDGFTTYKRIEYGQTSIKGGVSIDNHSVIPYHPRLLLRYQAHINIEWCNQSTSIKYLIKYINKGYDRITIVIDPLSESTSNTICNAYEIQHYLAYKYISPCEAC